MRESSIYINAKRWFSSNGYVVLAGQPPNGSDNIPVVEIKSVKNIVKGSSGSYKPDLIVCNAFEFWLVECKPRYSRTDEVKLESVLRDPTRITFLYAELRQRKLWEKNNLQSYYPSAEKLAEKMKLCLANTEIISPRLNVYNLTFGLADEPAIMTAPKSIV